MSAMRVAIASNDGKNINEPFGRARKFYIYDVDEKVALREVREAGFSIGHIERMSLVQDCDILIASRMGQETVDALFFSDIYPLVISDEIEKTLEKLRSRIRAFGLRQAKEIRSYSQSNVFELYMLATADNAWSELQR